MTLNPVLIIAAIIPVAILCYYVYKKDVNKEPKGLLAKIFIFGILIAIPTVFAELLVEKLLSPLESNTLIYIFVYTFLGVAIVEEFFKWLVVRTIGYNSKNFDELYDIIVYAVFSSLGFACFENILYVLGNGLSTAIMRAILSIPGHMCFGVLMGYYMSKAKVNSLNGNHDLATKNMILSILIPTIAHTAYDAFIAAGVQISALYIILFFISDIIIVVFGIKIVNKMSKIQQNISNNLKEGNITTNNQGNLINNIQLPAEINFCPVCGDLVKGYNYCPSCGFKLTK